MSTQAAPASHATYSEAHLVAAPGRSRTSNTAMATAITVIVTIIGLWTVLGYVHSLAAVLSSVDATNKEIVGKLQVAGAGLKQLDAKTDSVRSMNTHATQLQGLLGDIDSDMGQMVSGVQSIGDQMKALDGSLVELDQQVTAVAGSNAKIADKLGGIDTGLRSQARQVAGMRTSVAASSAALGKVPQTIGTTNARLAHINQAVCYMGRVGVHNNLKVYVDFLGIPNGNAVISATMIPTGSWRC